jgi:uncharacterized damage-inducible protein DinB
MRGEGASFQELLAYTDGETERWRAWLAEQPPEVLQLPIGEGDRATVRDVIGHVFAVELRYAQRLLDRPVTEYDRLDTSTLDALWGIHREARGLFREYLESAADGGRGREMTFQTRTLGPLSASAHKVAVHVFIHGIRHWAQIALVLRQAGFRQPWEHDWLLGDARD